MSIKLAEKQRELVKVLRDFETKEASIKNIEIEELNNQKEMHELSN